MGFCVPLNRDGGEKQEAVHTVCLPTTVRQSRARSQGHGGPTTMGSQGVEAPGAWAAGEGGGGGTGGGGSERLGESLLPPEPAHRRFIPLVSRDESSP